MRYACLFRGFRWVRGWVGGSRVLKVVVSLCGWRVEDYREDCREFRIMGFWELERGEWSEC